MTQDKQIKQFAKQLLKISLEGSDLSVERVGGVLQSLEKQPPRHHLAVLKAYLKLVVREVAKSTAVISHAGALSAAAAEEIARQLSTKYGRSMATVTREDPSLIAGLRVVVDCDVYDSSISDALSRLQSSLS
ncbi:MAG TPA: F0F1 ATP synthase subunit delta [Planctomycetaceae bacterium]|nr:F0F1 ATP synthase subunit delta [Planctomycetaceae bacterium]